MGKKISEEIIEQCQKMYIEEGLSCEQIAKKVGIGASTVSRRLKKLGVQIVVNPKAAKFDISQVINEYKSGKSIQTIARDLKSSEKTISEAIKSAGIEVFRNGVTPAINYHIFDTIDTEEKAYWLGFIWADGCIINIKKNKPNYAFELSLSVKDIEHLRKFCKFANISESKIKIRKNNGLSKDKEFYLCRVQISSKHLWNTLNNYGCVPNKTTNEIFPSVNIFSNIKLIPHFIRGIFDGDGWVYLDNRHLLIAGICGQENFLLRLMDFLPQNLHKDKCLSCNNTDVIKVIKYGCNPAIEFVKFLYSNSTIYLDRKYNIIAPYIREDVRKSGNIGESPTNEDNTEINSGIAKGSESSQSVESE